MIPAALLIVVCIAAWIALLGIQFLRETDLLRQTRLETETAIARLDAVTARTPGLLDETESGTPVHDALARELGAA